MPRFYDSPNLFQEDILVRIQALMDQVAATQKRIQGLEQELRFTKPPYRRREDEDPEGE
ncbi:MAG: hypothetical protein IH857_06415 [Deltaproteobacteria bacterium]|nr:hypothetical protein [Deltaproteobacteria bacterium]